MQAESTDSQIEQTRFNQPAHSSSRSGGVAASVWLGGLLLLLILAVVLFNLLRSAPGFTLIVRGATQGSDVFIDKVRYGVAQADGTLRVAGLKAGRQRSVRVAHEGYADFNTSVSGENGKELTIVAQLRPASTAALPPEIDYKGAMVLVAAGEFVMGDDRSGQPNESPAHRVTLPDFYIDKFEVTNEQYRNYCAEKNCTPPDPWWQARYFADEKNRKLPVIGVSWEDAAAYAAWAGKRLPTEEEWEKAAAWDAQAARRRKWPWGDVFQAWRANVGRHMPAEAGQRREGASYYGAQDMAGNVIEWVDAPYQPYEGNAVPGEPYGANVRILRGGHFESSPDDTRTARRIYWKPEFTANYREWLTGFRCAVSATDAGLQQHLSGAVAAQK